MVYVCFSSDFLIEDADKWRTECWEMIRERSDLHFLFLTKRIERFLDCVPHDWESGYENVTVGCTVENQENADYRLHIFPAFLLGIKILFPITYILSLGNAVHTLLKMINYIH